MNPFEAHKKQVAFVFLYFFISFVHFSCFELVILSLAMLSRWWKFFMPVVSSHLGEVYIINEEKPS